MILVIDNYDSFTFNVIQILQTVTDKQIKVVRNDECSVEQLAEMNPKYLIVSPGPGSPYQAGICEDAIKYFAGKIPILGICLGHQAICEAFGARIVQAKYIKHGIVEEIKLDGKGLFRTIGNSAKFTRYHSLVADEQTLSDDFEITARALDGDIMGVRHKTLPIEGIQFHPESIASEAGKQLLSNFIMDNVTDGSMDERAMAAILVAMAAKGFSVSEMTGCAQTLLKKKKDIPVDSRGLAEIVGTGGDGKGSFNISSMSAIVAASCGQKMAKHGNRAVSSKSGAADFYENLGINIMASPEKTAKLIEKTGFGFLMAPVYHSAMRFAGPVRKVLGIKTIMNVLGPLLNPAGAEYEVLGVYSPKLLKDYARTAKALGAKRVMVVCSQDGYDEISPIVPTDVYQIDEKGNENQYVIKPENFGISSCDEDELIGGNGKENASLAMDVLEGKGKNTIKQAVALNTAAVLYLSGKTRTLKDGYDMAISYIESGKALEKLKEIQKISSEL